MSRRYLSTLIVGVVFVGLVAWVLLQERGRVTEEGEVFALQISDLSQLRVEGKTAGYTLERRSGQWWFTAPFAGQADPAEAKRVVNAIAALKPLKRTGQDLKNPDFGLDKPQLTVTVTYHGNQTAVLRLGQPTLGEKLFATISVDPQALFIVDQSVLADVDRKPEDMRDKKLVDWGPDQQVKEVTVQRPSESVTVKRVPLSKEPSWKITAPRELPADAVAVESVINGVASAEAADFLPYTAENLAATGLNAPAVAVTLTAEQEAVTVYLGKTAARPRPAGATEPVAGPQQVVYATRSGRPEILALDVSALADLNKGMQELRDRHVLAVKQDAISALQVQRSSGLSFALAKSGKEWKMTAPQPGAVRPEKLSDLLFALTDLQSLEYVVEGQANVDLTRYGLQTPSTAISVTVTGRSQPTVLLIGAAAGTGQRVYAKTSLSPDVFIIDGALVRDLPAAATDLLAPAAGTPAPPGAGAPPNQPAPPGTRSQP
ncbi:MAG TPA: DUF4340 domain-containing protein [Armatimonadota bacterium]|jgi:hypothetical protein